MYIIKMSIFLSNQSATSVTSASHQDKLNSKHDSILLKVIHVYFLRGMAPLGAVIRVFIVLI